MKTLKLTALAVAVMMTACEKTVYDEWSENSENSEYSEESEPTKKFTFTLKGDFSDAWRLDVVGNIDTGDAGEAAAREMTRGYLAADGKDMTDIWVLDYMNGTLVQQLHQSDNTADDFGRPTMRLAYGSHHVYFIASRGSAATLNTDVKTITFGSVRDTFWKDYTVDVVSTSNGNRAVTLDRVVTRLRLTFTDAISSDAATINFAPHKWYYGLDYISGTPVNAITDQTVTINIPASELGNTGVQASIFGFSTATEWTTDVSINSKKSSGEVIGSATIANVPFKANRISELSGPLFGSEGAMTLSLNTNWETAYNGAW